uniref:Uncharacterized protein n=1 Tax=Nelumbo nucifera TaxID=4432 RepID=A0A822YWI1_NELNU|nr:TPA_asm: hypothetical protein HUJ06_007511 [Nelumbo nucifera]
MVPYPNSPQSPYFHECVKWLLENQFPDGSWCFFHSYPLVIKDTLSSTLACVLALKRWNIGNNYIKKGINFIVSNLPSSTGEKKHVPIGFDIVFPGMIEYAREMGLILPLIPTIADALFHRRNLEFKMSYFFISLLFILSSFS